MIFIIIEKSLTTKVIIILKVITIVGFHSYQNKYSYLLQPNLHLYPIYFFNFLPSSFNMEFKNQVKKNFR